MAALTDNQVGERIPQGRFFEQTYRVTTSADAADEWIATSFGNVEAVIGYAIHGTATATPGVTFVLNGQGTGATEDANPGDLGLETDIIADIQVTVLGRA